MYNADPFIKGTTDADLFICSSMRHCRSRTIFILNSNKTDWNVILCVCIKLNMNKGLDNIHVWAPSYCNSKTININYSLRTSSGCCSQLCASKNRVCNK